MELVLKSTLGDLSDIPLVILCFLFDFFILFYILYLCLCLCFLTAYCAQYKIQVTMERALVIQLLSEWTLIWKITLESYNL